MFRKNSLGPLKLSTTTFLSSLCFHSLCLWWLGCKFIKCDSLASANSEQQNGNPISIGEKLYLELEYSISSVKFKFCSWYENNQDLATVPAPGCCLLLVVARSRCCRGTAGCWPALQHTGSADCRRALEVMATATASLQHCSCTPVAAWLFLRGPSLVTDSCQLVSLNTSDYTHAMQ